MHTSYAMMASSVTPPAEDEGMKVDGVAGARGAAVSVCVRLRRSWASLRLTVAALMSPMMKKWLDGGKEIENGKESTW